VVELESALASNGEEVSRTLEKTILLSVIDEKWKNHLREMDELRVSVQNAVFEQKDPLVVYKFESYELFQQVLNSINEQVISLMMKAEIEAPRGPVRQAEVERDDFSKMKTKKENLEAQRREVTREAQANSAPNVPGMPPPPQEDDRPMSRRERRLQDQDKKKRR
jgi:preprotein translocase subunit SecA